MSPGRALVVGASSDIGSAIAVRLAGLGHVVHLWGRDRPRLEATAERCRQLGVDAEVDQVEVTDRAQQAAALESLAAQGPLRVAVWAAGIFDWGPAEHADPDVWAKLMAVNLTAPAVFTPLALPLLTAAAPSALIYLGSAAGHTAFADNAAYVASKHGLTGLARATFLDVRDSGVKVCLVSPGLVDAGAGRRSPAGQAHPERLLSPDDIADAVGFVLSTSARSCPTEIRLQPQRTP